jgi:hypothetical protein
MSKIIFWVLWMFCLIGIVSFSIGVHESIHVIQIKQAGGSIEDFCALGYNKIGDGRFDAAGGWVTGMYVGENPSSELWPTILGLVVLGSLTTIGFIYFYKGFYDEKEKAFRRG